VTVKNTASTLAGQLAGRIKHKTGCPYGREERFERRVDGQPMVVRRCIECGGQLITPAAPDPDRPAAA
jgi:hypothetical protein